MKNILIYNKKTEGATLIELLIAITLSSFIFLSSSAVIFGLFSSNTRISQKDILEQTKNDLTLELSNNLKWSKNISITETNGSLTFERTGFGINTYKLQEGRLLKNDQPLTSSEVTITSFTISDYSKLSGTYAKSLLITISLEKTAFKSISDTLRIVVSQRQSANTVTT